MTTWEQKPVQSWIVRAVAFALPMVAAVGAAIIMSRVLPQPSDGLVVLSWWTAVIGTPLLTIAVVSRLARKLLPLSALLDLALAFPGVAPNRYRMALGSWSTRHMLQRMRQAQRGTASTEPAATAEFLLSLLATLGSHDASTRGHAERTRAYADLIATELKLSNEDRNRLRWVSLLHDIGKLTVPASLLRKTGPLESEESTHLRYHPEVGFELTRPLHTFLDGWERAILNHHERYDGRGYPDGLAGDRIALGARIVAVADAFDAMTSGRAYKTPMSAAEARKELAYRAGTQFDPTVVRAFLNVTTSRMHEVVGPLAAMVSVPIVGWLRRAGENGAVAAVAAVSVGALAIAGAVDLPAAAAGHGNAAVMGMSIEAEAIVIDLAGADPSVDPASVVVVSAPDAVEATANPEGTITLRPLTGYAGTVELDVATCDFSGECTVSHIVLELTAGGEPLVVTAPPGVTARLANQGAVELATMALAPTAPARIPTAAPTTTPPATTAPATTVGSTTTTTTTTSTTSTTAPPTTLVITVPPPTTVAPTMATVPPTTTAATAPPPTTTTTAPPPTTTTTAPPPTTTTTAPPPTTTPTTVPNALPAAADDAATTDEDTPITVDVLANDSDEAPGSLTVTVTEQPSQGIAAVLGNQIVFTPHSNATSAQSFTYEICDAGGLCDTAKVEITINSINDAPVAIPDTAETDRGAKVRIKVVDNDTDADGDALHVEVSLSDTVSALGGKVDCSKHGHTECEYDPPASWDGSADSFSYVVSDGHGATAMATVTITLKP